ncbi:hypothetical protein PIB30_046292 [Stylosanthes scabra]|uniref:Gnk2-homologous domain-containing protein n=1 Tax=Stylosanthes scabra TaxID=79078 RepID=A0ABU6QFU9_9FABA|nr:hypothetical protein [Stylosanthes scabra]
METSYYVVVLCVTSLFFVLVLPNGFCIADRNLQRGSECSAADHSVMEAEFETNLGSLLDSLASNVVGHHGFYQASVGKKNNKVYGEVLCRGDISANNCSNCISESVKFASHNCPKSREVLVWFTWCFLRYSNESFFGVMESTAAAITNDTDLEDPSLVSEGLDVMSSLVVSAPEQPYMFQTLMMMALNRSRYGMVQCTRDISRTDCLACLKTQVTNFRNVIGNKRRWEIYGHNCFMWYNDYQFYSDVTPLLSDARRTSCVGILAIVVTVVSFLLVL